MEAARGQEKHGVNDNCSNYHPLKEFWKLMDSCKKFGIFYLKVLSAKSLENNKISINLIWSPKSNWRPLFTLKLLKLKGKRGVEQTELSWAKPSCVSLAVVLFNWTGKI